MVRLGQGSYIAMGVIAQASPLDYLNKVAVNTDMKLWFRAQENTDNMQYERNIVAFPEVSNYDQPIDSVIEGTEGVTGSVTFMATYSYFQDLLRILTGHSVTRTGDNTYTFVPVEPNSASHYLFGTTKRHLAIEVFRNDSGGNSVYYQGCVPTSFSIRYEGNSFLEVTMEFIGRGISISSKSTPVYKDNPIQTPTGKTDFFRMDLGGGLTKYRCSSATLNVSMPLAARYDVADIAASAIPLQSGKREVALEVEVEAPDTDTAWMALMQNPKGSRVQQAQLFINDTSASPTKSFTLDVYHATAAPPIEPRVTGVGVLTANLSLTGHSKDSSPVVKAFEPTLVLTQDPSVTNAYYNTPQT